MKLNALFCDGMVLAANRPIRVFGEGQGTVAVRFLQYEARMTSTKDRWCLTLPAIGHGGPYQMEIELNGVRTVLQDVYVGEVLLLHGQSNMKFQLRESNYPIASYQTCKRLRVFTVDNEYVDLKGLSQQDGWVSCDEETAGCFSAIGYHVGLQIASERDCAVGLISCSVGASVIESWMPKGTFADMGIDLSCDQIHFDHRYYPFNGEGFLYDRLLPLLVPYSLSCVIWYQGESNATPDEGALYDKMLTRLIAERRRDFEDENLPFVIIQLADCDNRAGRGWTLVQEAQMRVAQSVPYVKAVVCRDVCETNHIHPPTKHLLAKRVAEAILEKN